MDAAIRTFGLTKFYGQARGIEEIDLEARRGEVFGFLGPNGAGKTTTIRLLLDLLRPTRGRAEIFGLDTRGGSLALEGVVTAAMYILNFMALSLGSVRWLEDLSLFHHLNPFEILLSGSVNWTGAGVHIAVGAATLLLTLFIFERRDLSY